MTAARRLLLSTTGLEVLRRRALEPPLTLPPGFALEPVGACAGTVDVLAALVQDGVALGDPAGQWSVHPSVAGDLHVLAVPELAVTVRAARPGLDVTACLAVAGPRGAGLLRTGDTAVQLSAFAAVDLADELARVVPAPLPGRPRGGREELPLESLLDRSGSAWHQRVAGTLHATVVSGSGPDRVGGVVGSVEWVWDGAGWTGLQALPSRAGRPWVRLVPVAPADLGAWLAPLLAAAA